MRDAIALDTSVPAVVLGAPGHGELGITRSLGRLGIPVHVIDHDRWAPAFFSKYGRRRIVWDLHGRPATQSLAFLCEFGERIGRRSVLIATSDIGAMFLADHAARLAEHFIFPERTARLVRSLCSKREMYDVARACGVPTPASAFPRSRAEVLEYVETARLPILLKGILARKAGKLMILVHTRDQLLHAYDSLDEPSRANVMLQEYIPGDDSMTWTFNGYFDRDGECSTVFTGRKLRNYPAYFGTASLAVCVANDVVAQTTIRFMKAIGYRGPLDLGYRYDARDGRYKVNDINPRIGAMFRLFVGANGIDVARALYQDMTGQPVTPSTIQEGRRWLVEDHDLISACRYIADGYLTIRQWFGSLRGVGETAYFSWDDPMPLAAVGLGDGRRVLKALRRRWHRRQPAVIDHHHEAQAKALATETVSPNLDDGPCAPADRTAARLEVPSARMGDAKCE